MSNKPSLIIYVVGGLAAISFMVYVLWNGSAPK
jgi:hypothetical protein